MLNRLKAKLGNDSSSVAYSGEYAVSATGNPGRDRRHVASQFALRESQQGCPCMIAGERDLHPKTLE